MLQQFATNSKALNLEQKCGPFQDRVQLTQCAVKGWFTVLLRERVDNHYYYQPDNLTWLHTTSIHSLITLQMQYKMITKKEMHNNNVFSAIVYRESFSLDKNAWQLAF